MHRASSALLRSRTGCTSLLTSIADVCRNLVVIHGRSVVHTMPLDDAGLEKSCRFRVARARAWRCLSVRQTATILKPRSTGRGTLLRPREVDVRSCRWPRLMWRIDWPSKSLRGR